MINWGFCKKIFVTIVEFLFKAFLGFVFFGVYVYLSNMIRKFFYLDISYFTDIPYSVYENLNFRKGDRELLQYYSIRHALDSMYYNEYFFYLCPNTEAIIQSKMEYQEELKILSDKLNFQDFENPNHGLKFLSAFYEHYLKIIELNNDLIELNNNLIKNNKL